MTLLSGYVKNLIDWLVGKLQKGMLTNSADPDQKPQNAASDQVYIVSLINLRKFYKTVVIGT